MANKSSLLFFVVILSLTSLSLAKWDISGFSRPGEDFVFIGKFIFSEGDGTMTFGLADDYVIPADDYENCQMKLLLYNDDEDSINYWPAVYQNDTLTCQQKAQRAIIIKDYPCIVPDKVVQIGDTFDHPTSWYVAVSDCSITGAENFQMAYAIHYLNPGSFWTEEFSKEDQNILTIYFLFFFAWLVFIPAFIGALFYLRRKRLIGTLLQLFSSVLFFESLAITLYLVHYFIYALDGIGTPPLLVIADTIDCLSTLIFFVVLLQVVTISKTPIDMPLHAWIVGSCLLLLYQGMFLWQEMYSGINPYEETYKWQTIPGIIMICTQVVFCIYFFIAAIITSIRNRSQAAFLMIFASVYSVWLLILPFMVTVMLAAQFYYRYKWVLGISMTVNLFAYILFAFLSINNPIMDKINELLGNTSISDISSKPSYNADIIQNSLLDNDTGYGAL